MKEPDRVVVDISYIEELFRKGLQIEVFCKLFFLHFVLVSRSVPHYFSYYSLSMNLSPEGCAILKAWSSRTVL